MAELTPQEHEVLLGNRGFAALSKPLRERIVARATRQKLADGELLYARDDAPDGWYGLLSGAIRISNTTAEGRDVILAYMEPGVWFGELSLIDGLPRAHDGRAVGVTEYLLLAPAEFAAAHREWPELLMSILRIQAGRMRLMFSTIEDLNTLPLEARLAKQLLNLARTYGAQTGEGFEIGLKLPQEELAQMLGASRQRVNQELKAWERAGLLTTRYGRLVLHDREALRKIATA